MPEYPVYEKDGRTQIAATPQREVELEFDGWRKQSPADQSEASPAGGAAPGQAKSKPSK